MKIAVIGGGAAGFFSAISCVKHFPAANVDLLEKSDKLLAKVRISGGGRCNVTNATFTISDLIQHYPRGNKFLKKCFSQFATSETIEWFESKGVRIKTEPDGRMFPVSDNSQSIIDCLISETKKAGIAIRTGVNVSRLEKLDNKFYLHFNNEIEEYDRIIIATGGSPKLGGLTWLKELGHAIVPPVPSLFTFNMPKEKIKSMMGLAVDNAIVKIQGTKLQSQGPLLITHWGMSGPAILKLSAWGARILSDLNYHFNISINWSLLLNEEEVRSEMMHFRNDKKKLINYRPYNIPTRLWEYLLGKVEINTDKRWLDLNKKEFNRLVNLLVNDTYKVEGKTTFKEEFVTCGGISLSDINSSTMESKVCPGVYFCGEVVDIDGVTGGFNFQAAWTTGFIAGKNVGA